MGIIADWAAKRNRKKLERINRELERLKQLNISPYDQRTKHKGSKSSGKGHETYVKRDTNPILLIIIGLAVVIIIALTVFSKGKYNNLKEEYDEKVSELQLKTLELLNTSSALEDAEKKLKSKEFIESDLSEKYDELIEQKDNLEEQRDDLVKEVQNLQNQVAEFDKIVQNKTIEIKYWKNCITDELDESLSVCNSSN